MSLGESVLKNPLDNLDDVDVNVDENGGGVAPEQRMDYEPNDNHRTVRPFFHEKSVMIHSKSRKISPFLSHYCAFAIRSEVVM